MLYSVTQSCTIFGPLDCSPLGSSVHGTFQARIFQGVHCIPASRGSSWPKVQTHISCVSCTTGKFFTIESLVNLTPNSIIYHIKRQITWLLVWCTLMPLQGKQKDSVMSYFSPYENCATLGITMAQVILECQGCRNGRKIDSQGKVRVNQSQISISICICRGTSMFGIWLRTSSPKNITNCYVISLSVTETHTHTHVHACSFVSTNILTHRGYCVFAIEKQAAIILQSQLYFDSIYIYMCCMILILWW